MAMLGVLTLDIRVFFMCVLVAAPPVEVCVFLMSQQAVRLQCDDGRDLTAAQLLQTVLEEEEIALPPVASQVFGIWMISPLLGISCNII